MNQIKFDNLVTNLLKEQPVTMPTTKPITKPSPTTPRKPSPSAPNPDPFRRHKPGTMPKQRPLASRNLKNRIQSIINKYITFMEQ